MIIAEYPFYNAFTRANDFYGVTMTEDDFENMGMSAWDKIGNKRYRLYRYETEPIEDEVGNYYVNIPCNAHIIEAVVADYEDYQKTSNQKEAPDNDSGWKEGYIESRKFNTNSLYISGKYIKYREEGDKLYLADRFSTVRILFKGVITDDEGLPSLTEGEVDAIAVFCAYMKMYKEALVTRNPNTYQLAENLKVDWLHKCTQARAPEYLNQNEMDEILNASSSWDRKRYGKSFKPIR